MHFAGRRDPVLCIDSHLIGRVGIYHPVVSGAGLYQSSLQLPEENVLDPPVHTLVYMGSTKRTTIRLTDDRQRLLEQAKEVVAADQYDDPPNSDVIDAALTHLIESKENFEEARTDMEPMAIKQFNTSVIGFRYRTSIESKWR